MPLFEVAVIKKPTKKAAEENNAQEELLFGPTTVLAKDQQSAVLTVFSKNPPKDFDPNRDEVLIRPF